MQMVVALPNKVVAWRLIGSVVPNADPSRSDWPLAVRIIDQILRAALPLPFRAIAYAAFASLALLRRLADHAVMPRVIAPLGAIFGTDQRSRLP
jgi:hypothetical protein